MTDDARTRLRRLVTMAKVRRGEDTPAPEWSDVEAVLRELWEADQRAERYEADCGRLMREASKAVRVAELAGIYLRALDEVRAKSGSPFATWRAAEDALDEAEATLREALK